MKSKNVQYYVEGKDDKKLVEVLKTDLRVIRPGKVEVLNVMQHEIADMRLRAISRATMVVLVFDTDAGNSDTLRKNIKKLQDCSAVSELVLIPQVPNLEGELVRSCNIRRIEELLNSKSRADFKSDIIRVTNLAKKLQEHRFDINLFWNENPTSLFRDIENQSAKIKLAK